MTQTNLEKIIQLKNTIQFLYEKEGRSKVYISKLLEVNRGTLGKQISEWGLKQGVKHYLTPSNQKFLNKNFDFIASQIQQRTAFTDIAKKLNISRKKLYNLIETNEKLLAIKEEVAYKKEQELIAKNENKKKPEFATDLEKEEWKEVLGFEEYQVSNKGRVKKFSDYYKNYILLKPTPNCRNGRLYISLYDGVGKRKNLQVSRLVGYAFCEGYSEINNTIDHLDGDITNNDATNLQWVPQKINNKRAFDNGKKPVIGYKRNGKFKKIIYDDKYEFKTIRALAKFLHKSETQTARYISGECSCDVKIELVY